MSKINGLAEIRTQSRYGDARDLCRKMYYRLKNFTPQSTIHMRTKNGSYFVRKLFSIEGSIIQTDRGPIDLVETECIQVYENS